MRADYGIVDPRWRRLLARGHRITRKTLNGGYLRELSARPLAGAPLSGPVGDPAVAGTVAGLNPRVPVARRDLG